MAIAIKGLTIGCTATVFPPLRGSKSAREPGVEAVDKHGNPSRSLVGSGKRTKSRPGQYVGKLHKAWQVS